MLAWNYRSSHDSKALLPTQLHFNKTSTCVCMVGHGATRVKLVNLIVGCMGTVPKTGRYMFVFVCASVCACGDVSLLV